MRRSRKSSGIVDLFDGFDTILVLPAWFIFSMLVSIPVTGLLLVIVMWDTIAANAGFVLVGIFVLILAAMATLVIISGAFARSARAVIETIIAFLDSRDNGTTINVEGGSKTVEGNERFDASGQGARMSGRQIRRKRLGDGSSGPSTKGTISRKRKE